MKMKKAVANKSEFAFEDDDLNDDFAPMESACSHCQRKAQLAQLRAITAQDSDIRMSGYLKKKRHSITGGWRKLYFVLQNRFLVSYRSRDIYEPIKDIIKLEPGMTIIPSAGLRFEIMANSYALYTFRCDSQQSFSEWITILLDSFANVSGEATYERKFSQKENLQSSSIVPIVSSEVCLAVTTDKATAATDGGSRAVGPVMPARKSSGTGSINVPKLTLLSDGDALKSNALPQPVENEKRQKNNENNNKQTKIMHQSVYGEADHQRTEEVITQSFQFPDKSKLSSNISESSVPEQNIDIHSPVMGDQSFGTESGTSRSCSDLPTSYTSMYMNMNKTSLSKSSMKVAMHSYNNVHEYVPMCMNVLPKPNNPCVAPPSPNITLRENEIFQEMPPIYATIDVKAKKHRREQLQQLANGLPTSIKQSNSDDELPLSMGTGERSRTVDDSGCHIYEEIGNILPPIMVNQKSPDSDVNVSDVRPVEKTKHPSTLTGQLKCDYELLSNEPLVSVRDPTNQNSAGSSSVYPLYEDVKPPVAVTELMIMCMDDDNRETENCYEEIFFPPPASGDTLNRTTSMLLPAGNKTTQSSTTKHDRSMVYTFWKMLRRVAFPGSSHSRKESQRDSGQQQSPEESIILQRKGRTMDGCSRKGQKKSLRKRIMKSLMFAR